MKALKKAFSWLKKTVGLGMGVIRNHSFVAVLVTDRLKSIVRSPIVQAGVKLTPTLVDDRALAFVDKVALPVLEEVCIIHGILREHEKNSVAVEEIIERLQHIAPELETKVYIDYAGRLNLRMADGILTLQEAIDQAQDTFFTFFKK